MNPILLVDARNYLYRAIAAGSRQYGGKRHSFVIMLRMLTGLIHRYKPAAVQLFWDARRDTVWRRQLAAGYKLREQNQRSTTVAPELAETETVARACFDWLGVCQFQQPAMEADDLIYAACLVQAPRPLIIASTDSDLTQIPYRMEHVRIWHHERNRELERPVLDPVLLKVLQGDAADTITGYQGVGPVTAKRLAADPQQLEQFLEQSGNAVFALNQQLVDLGRCPYLEQNQQYIRRQLLEPVAFDRAHLVQLERQYRIAGLISEYANVVLPFKLLT